MPALSENLFTFNRIVFHHSSRYFEDEDEQQHSQLEYIPAPDSPTNKKSECDSDSSEDPLDAFMEGLEKEVCIIQLKVICIIDVFNFKFFGLLFFYVLKHWCIIM